MNKEQRFQQRSFYNTHKKTNLKKKQNIPLDDSDILADVWCHRADEHYNLLKQHHFCWISGN